MSERERERLYWRLSLVFALASPLAVYSTAKAGFSPSYSPLDFAVIGFLSIPFAVLTELLLVTLFGGRGAARIWMVRPSVQSGRALALTAAQALDAVASRLQEFGFAFTQSGGQGGPTRVAFAKPKAHFVKTFLDHGFFGEVALSPAETGASLACRLTFDDTLILETGEMEQVRGLCDYFSLRTQGFSYEQVPFVLYCGLFASFATAAFSLVPGRVVGDATLTCLSLMAASLLAVGMLMLLRDRAHLFGGRLFFVGLYLSSLPFLSLLAG